MKNLKNYKSVPNRKTFKTKNHKAGNFTSIPNNLLHHPTLSLKAKMLMIQLLSDSDEFTLSPSLYAKRMNTSVSNVYNAIKELVKDGFIRKTLIEKPIRGLKKKGSSKK